MQKVLLITGGSRGIGRETVKLAAQSGYAVCFTYRSKKEIADELAGEVSQLHNTPVLALQVDLADEKQIVSLFEKIDSHFGRLDGLVNNAGILEQQGPIDIVDAARLLRIFSVNVFGSFLCAREAVKRMSTARGGTGGVIVNLSSVAAMLGAPGEYVDYAASKGAIDTFTVGLAKEVASQGIRVNAVRPGVIETEIHASGGEPRRVDRVKNAVPMQRGGRPEEVASTILWLLSDAASYITGTWIDVSGGR